MATSFEEYVQLELPKRPFLQEDVPTESIIIRRGIGARQLDGLELEEGEILIKRSGVLVAEPLDSVGVAQIDGITHIQSTPALTWTVTHNKSNKNVVITLLDSAYREVIADEVSVGLDAITFSFAEVQTGIANVIFLPA